MSASENELAVIRQELNELRQAFTAMRGNGNGHAKTNGTSFVETAESNAMTDRRGMLKKMAGLAVGVATVGLLRPTSSNAAGRTTNPGTRRLNKLGAPSVTGDPWLVGTDEDADVFTGLFNTTTAQIDTQLRVRNYGLTDFVPPAGTNIGVVGYCDDEFSTLAAFGQVGLWGEARSVMGGKGFGVIGFAGNDVGGVGGSFNGGDAGVIVTGGRVTLCLFATTEIFPPTSGTGHAIGEVVVDQDYTMWYSIGPGAPAPFRRLAGPDSTIATGSEQMLATVGALSGFPLPPRFVDTRTGSGNTYAGQHLAGGTVAMYQIAGVTVNGNTVPTGATAVIGRIADPNPTGNGTLFVGSVVAPGMAGVLRIMPNEPGNTEFFSLLDAGGALSVDNSSAPGTSVDIIIDIDGYYL